MVILVYLVRGKNRAKIPQEATGGIRDNIHLSREPHAYSPPKGYRELLISGYFATGRNPEGEFVLRC